MKKWIKIPLAISLIVGFAASTTAFAECKSELSFVSASDDGTSQPENPPKNAIDGNLDGKSRWSSKSEGAAKSLDLKLSASQTIGAVGIAWLKGNERWSSFSIATSVDGKTFKTVVPNRKSSGKNAGLEQYAFAPVTAQFVRISANGNAKNSWNSVVEAKAYGCS